MSLDASLGLSLGVIGNPNQVTSDGPGLGDNSKACVPPKQPDWGISRERSYGINKMQHPGGCPAPTGSSR